MGTSGKIQIGLACLWRPPANSWNEAKRPTVGTGNIRSVHIWHVWETPSANPVWKTSTWMPVISKKVNKWHGEIINSGSKPVHRHFSTHLDGSSGMGWMFKTNNYSRSCSFDVICGIVSFGVDRNDHIYRIWIKVHFSTVRNETEYSVLKKQWNFASGVIEISPFSLLRTVITKTFLLPELHTQCYCVVKVNIFSDQWRILRTLCSVRFAKLYFVNCCWSML
jgi:hypothetical protein